jgi:hypothetical protein
MSDGRMERRGCVSRVLFRLAPAAVALALLIGFVLFPGARLGMAITMGTGWGGDRLQSRIDALEAKAIAGESMSDEDLDFLEDLFRTLATGGRLSWVLRQTGQMMDHYLDGTGEPLYVRSRIFLQSGPVQDELEKLRARIADRGAAAPTSDASLCSPTFNMIDSDAGDAKYGLYYGRICVDSISADESGTFIRWRAVVTWVWPSYAYQQATFGDPHEKRSDLPNLMCLTVTKKWRPTVRCEEGEALWVDDGLGEYLTHLGLARSFDVIGEWEEVAGVGVQSSG